MPADHASVIRFTLFAAVTLLLLLAETLWPRRRRVVPHSRRSRWPANFGVAVLNGVLAGVLIPLGALGVAAVAEVHHWGLLNQLAMPAWVSVAIALLVLDLAIYWQHRVFHQVPLLWRLHRMHHADRDLDVSSGGRFHTLEILLSALYKMVVVLMLGPAPVAVLIFEVVLNATAMFNHANLAVPARLDAWLRRVVVTPDMHRVHHSSRIEETNSNYGFNVPWWDRLFGTYRAQPVDGHDGMDVGLEHFRRVEDQQPLPMWLIPFRRT